MVVTATLAAMKKSSDAGKPKPTVRDLLIDRFRCPVDIGEFRVTPDLGQGESGYFRLGEDTVFGRCSSGVVSAVAVSPLHDAYPHVKSSGTAVELPFDPAQLIDNLQSERYCKCGLPGNWLVRNVYYKIRPLMPVRVRRHLQKLYFRQQGKHSFPQWPVDFTVDRIYEKLLATAMKFQNIDKIPFIWFWPDGLPSCTMLTHDVETAEGRDFCSQLMDLDDAYGIKAAFHLVPEKRYTVPDSLVREIRARGFEMNVHDLNHDAYLFSSREVFLERAAKINDYLKYYQTQGFRSAVMYRNLDWMGALDIAYDMSVPNSAHLDPQQGGCCTAMPFFVGPILELPATAIQDYPLFNILGDYSIRIWKEQISLIRQHHGLISFIVHPDYIVGNKAQTVYKDLLQYLAEMKLHRETWAPLPGEINAWWRLRSRMSLVQVDQSWRIEGQGSERARIAHAVRNADGVTYEIDGTCI